MINQSRKHLLVLVLGAALMAPLAMANDAGAVNGAANGPNQTLPIAVTPKVPMASTPPIVDDPTPAAVPGTGTTTTTTTSTDATATTPAQTPAPAKATASAGQSSWANLDTDKDGNLSKSEAAGDPGMKAIFAKADANADGMLTADEYRAYYAKYQASVNRK